MHITLLLETAKRGDAIRIQFFNQQFQPVEWAPGSAGELSVSVNHDNESFDLTLDVGADGNCHRRQKAGVKKRFAALAALVEGG